MDPLGNQPSQAQPTPQQAPVSPPPTPLVQQPVVSPEPTRPAPVSQDIAPQPERPVEAWPPAGTPAAQEAAQISQNPAPQPQQPGAPKPLETQNIGTQVAEVTGAIPVVTPASTSTPGGIDGFVSPAAKEIKDSISANQPSGQEGPMSDQQADKLFQEEPATKDKKKHSKLKKVMLSFIVLLITGLGATAGYVYLFGNKAAQNYSNSSSTSTYKEAFGQIQTALSANPVDTAELQAGFNKLKVAQNNSSKLSPVVLGRLNPNYKKAQESVSAEAEYQAKVKDYQEKYADYTDYLGAVSGSLTVISDLGKLSSVDLTKTTAEQLNTSLSALLSSCNESVKTITTVTKPKDLSDSTIALQKNLISICTESIDSLEDGVIVLVTGKTGILSAADQAKAKLYLDGLATTPTTIGKGDTNKFNLEDLTNYQQAALEQAKTLAQ